MPDTSKLEKLNRELEKSEKKLRKAINDEKALQHQLKQLNHLIRSGMVDGRTYPVKLGVDYRPLCNIYGVEKSILPKLNFIEGETDIQQLTSYLESGNYVIEISAINPNESPEFLCPLNQEVTIYKDGLPYKTVSVIARAVVDFSLVESPGKNVGYTDVGGDCPIFYMSNEMFVELYNNPAIMSYVFDVEKEHFLPATEYINSLPTVEYASSETLAQTMNGLKQTIFIIGGLMIRMEMLWNIFANNFDQLQFTELNTTTEYRKTDR